MKRKVFTLADCRINRKPSVATRQYILCHFERILVQIMAYIVGSAYTLPVIVTYAIPVLPSVVVNLNRTSADNVWVV